MNKQNLLQTILDGMKNVNITANTNEIIKKRMTELPVNVKGTKRKLSAFYKKFYYFYLISKYDNPESLGNEAKTVCLKEDVITPQYIQMILFICIRRDYNLNEGELKLYYRENNFYVVQSHNPIARALNFSKAKEEQVV